MTQQVFGQKDSRAHSHLKARILDVFLVMKDLHELLVLLDTAGALNLTPQDEQQRQEQTSTIETITRSGEKNLRGFRITFLQRQVHGFLRGLNYAIQQRRYANPQNSNLSTSRSLQVVR